MESRALLYIADGGVNDIVNKTMCKNWHSYVKLKMSLSHEAIIIILLNLSLSLRNVTARHLGLE